MSREPEHPAPPLPAVGGSIPQLTVRAVATGMLLGGVLSLCNIYSGLKIGFTTNMSIATTLLGFGLWRLGGRVFRSAPFGLHENLINQTSGSAAASIAGAGLVAPIPALTMLTGRELGWAWLSVWALSVSVLGVLVGLGLRRRLIVHERLAFPYGVATAEMLREMYSQGREAIARLRTLLVSIGAAGTLKALVEIFRLPVVGLPGRWSLHGSVAGSAGLGTVSLKNLGFGLEPGVLMVGLGALIGMRACASLLLGALVAWGWLAPLALREGWVDPIHLPADQMWFTPLAGWTLWPGVALMVTAALTAFVISAVQTWRQARARRRELRHRAGEGGEAPATHVPRRAFVWALVVVTVVSVILQTVLFDIRVYAAICAVLLTFALAVVAGRVTGETGIAPIGAMGKITQLAFAGLAPGNPTANLMSANVTGGAASQCSDMLHDLKTGHLLGAWPRHQATSQFFGVLAGAVCGSAGYLLLVPDPSRQLVTAQWPAPAVAQWKAVAELFSKGVAHLPPAAVSAALIAGGVGVALAVLEKGLGRRARNFVPSAPSLGLAFVLPAHYAISAFLGGVLAWILARRAQATAERFTVVIAAGLIAGESLVGVAFALHGG